MPSRPATPARTLRRTRRKRAVTTETIVAGCPEAIIEHRLPPGTKLAEGHLGEIYGVSRTKARQALFQLARDKLVSLIPARGAFVAQPTVRDAREVYDARRMIEGALITRFVQRHTPEQLRALRGHLAEERSAIAANDVQSRNRLLGRFHVFIAEMAGNSVIAEILADLVSRASLISLLYQSDMSASCSSEEHAELLEAIERRDIAQAAQLMIHHLDHVEKSLALRDTVLQAVALHTVLTPARS